MTFFFYFVVWGETIATCIGKRVGQVDVLYPPITAGKNYMGNDRKYPTFSWTVYITDNMFSHWFSAVTGLKCVCVREEVLVGKSLDSLIDSNMLLWEPLQTLPPCLMVQAHAVGFLSTAALNHQLSESVACGVYKRFLLSCPVIKSCNLHANTAHL